MAGIAAGGAPAGDALPFLSAPHDSLRYGLPALKADVQLAHPVQAIQANVRARAHRARYKPAATLRAATPHLRCGRSKWRNGWAQLELRVSCRLSVKRVR